MEKAELFARFLNLAQIYFKKERGIDFYAERLGVGSDELTQIIWEMSDSNLPEWLETLERAV